MKITALYLLSVILLITPITASSSDSIPNAALRVTVQQKEDGKINKGFHVLELSCFDGNCSLTSVSLNQCGESGSGKHAFYPKVQYSTTFLDTKYRITIVQKKRPIPFIYGSIIFPSDTANQ